MLEVELAARASVGAGKHTRGDVIEASVGVELSRGLPRRSSEHQHHSQWYELDTCVVCGVV